VKKENRKDMTSQGFTAWFFKAKRFLTGIEEEATEDSFLIFPSPKSSSSKNRLL